MNQEIWNSIVSVLLPVLATALTTLFTWIGVALKTAYNEKINTEIKKSVVDSVVQCVEQSYKELKNTDKLTKAMELASGWLGEKGIKVSQGELTILIESAVQGIRQGMASNTVLTINNSTSEIATENNKNEAEG